MSKGLSDLLSRNLNRWRNISRSFDLTAFNGFAKVAVKRWGQRYCRRFNHLEQYRIGCFDDHYPRVLVRVHSSSNRSPGQKF